LLQLIKLKEDVLAYLSDGSCQHLITAFWEYLILPMIARLWPCGIDMVTLSTALRAPKATTTFSNRRIASATVKHRGNTTQVTHPPKSTLFTSS
jgi:hypothetical protein